MPACNVTKNTIDFEGEQKADEKRSALFGQNATRKGLYYTNSVRKYTIIFPVNLL